MNYTQLEDKLGKRVMDQCSTLYNQCVTTPAHKSRKDIIAGLDKYLSRITPLVGGGINTKELLDELDEDGFWDQVVVLTRYLQTQKENKRKKV